jgi:hypothetical protein
MLTSDAWMDQLQFQAQWVAADIFPDDMITTFKFPELEGLAMYRIKPKGLRERVATLTLESVVFADGCNPSGLRQIATWDEIVSYCNSLVTEA